jgi:tetratricopeptide (TPR) repeat protein
MLAAQPGWMTREQLALLFWPDASPSDALHHLRINLNRSRALLRDWGVPDALLAERSRLRLALASDLAVWRDAKAAALNPADWLQGWRLPGYGEFGQWCEETAQRLHAEWLEAARRPTAAAGPGAAPAGRTPEWQRLLASPAPALLLLGEPGAGKSTLLQAAYPQAPCLRGLEGLQGMPYRPLLDTLRGQTPVLERALREPSHPLRPYRLDLARVLPELAPDEPLPPLDALTARTRLVEALTRAFEALTPVLVVDDLQWCDAATTEWLVMLAHSGRLRWRAAARAQAMSPALEQALQSLQAAVRLERLGLAPLTPDALAQACQARWPDQPLSPTQVERLHALSGGNLFALGELMRADVLAGDTLTPQPLQQLIARRWQGLSEAACQAVRLAAVAVEPLQAQALGGTAACTPALERGLLREEPAGLRCAHDLIRQAVAAELSPAQRAALHRQVAQWLAQGPGADGLSVAEHYEAAGDAPAALAWRHRGGEQLKARGRFAEARAAWAQVAAAASDPTLALRARLELAALDLFDDLARGEAALEAVRARLGSLPDGAARDSIEARALAALVDNRVFAGDIPRAQTLAVRLRELLPVLAVQERVDGVEMLIELAMREPDIPAAWALLSQLRALAPQRPTVLSFEGQIHWFGGQIQAAHDALAQLLELHPDYCRGITIENDLAVMLQALGRLDEAETMARRSLHSWAGVAHTETLSLLVLGLILTSAGRHDEADAALTRALALAREQASPGFEAEALVRRARLLLQWGRADEAQAALDLASPLLAASPEPLRVSQLVMAQVLTAQGTGRPLPPGALERLHDVAQRSSHPLVQIRQARVEHALAHDAASATAAAERMAALARRAGVQEALAEGLLLQALSTPDPALAPTLAREAEALAARLGLAKLLARSREALGSPG